MITLKLLLLLLFIIKVLSLENKNPIAIVTRSIFLDSVPSGSAISIIDNHVFIVGDDSPYLFRYSLQYQPVEKYPILPKFAHWQRIPKNVKPDFECMVKRKAGNEHYLYIFGSGSKSPERDSLLVINTNHPESFKKHSLKAFYTKYTALTGASREDLNIEGAVILKGNLYLLNRGNNDIIITEWSGFMEVVSGGREIDNLEIAHHKILLPEIDGVMAGFSGAGLLPEANKILFTATVENTDNWIDDGEILGSFIGIIDPAKLAQPVEIAGIADGKGNKIIDKVEAVEFLKKDKEGNIIVLSITDNDNGSSNLMEIQVNY